MFVCRIQHGAIDCRSNGMICSKHTKLATTALLLETLALLAAVVVLIIVFVVLRSAYRYDAMLPSFPVRSVGPNCRSVEWCLPKKTGNPNVLVEEFMLETKTNKNAFLNSHM